MPSTLSPPALRDRPALPQAELSQADTYEEAEKEDDTGNADDFVLSPLQDPLQPLRLDPTIA